MKAHELNAGRNRRPLRAGRGISAGRGKTAGRGTKGQKARTGKKLRPGFEGGQNPLSARLPKLPGFVSHRIKPQTVTLNTIAKLSNKQINSRILESAGLIDSRFYPTRLVATGKLTNPKSIELQGASVAAIAAVEAAGGSFKLVSLERKTSKKMKLDK